MEFQLRELQATDLFSMVKILNGVGFKNIKNSINVNEIKDLKDKATEYEIGVKVVMSVLEVVLENLPSVENDVYKFAGSVAGMSANDVAKMKMGDFVELLISIAKKEEFKDFFNRASKLMK